MHDEATVATVMAFLSVITDKVLKVLDKNGELWRYEASAYTDAPEMKRNREDWAHMNEATAAEVRRLLTELRDR